jgi:RimJ/RimL family protein N-acetyltransferase
VVTIRTERLVLRRWRPSDIEPFLVLNNDPRVLEFLPGPLDRERCEAFVARAEATFDARGFGRWAVEVRADGDSSTAECIGFVGIDAPAIETAFTPCVEIGWRLSAEHWGRGYATEAARAALAFGFETVGLEEIVSFTVPANLRSRAVMERIGMQRDLEGDFDHPSLPSGHPLRPHVLYRARR